MTTGPAAPLSELERAALARLADTLVPRWNAMPSATDIDLAHGPIDRALEVRPDLVAPLRELLGQLGTRADAEHVAQLQREKPSQFQTLMQAVAGAYYMHQTVRRALGYTGQRRIEPPQ